MEKRSSLRFGHWVKTINIANYYSYDGEGRLTKDKQEEIDTIIWRVDGKVKFIKRDANSQKNNLSFDYDAFGRRTAKKVYSSSNVLEKAVYYTLDAQGNVMSTYNLNIDTLNSSLDFYQAEKFIYGSSRLGMLKDSVNVLGSAFTDTDSTNVTHTLGNKRYELSNHLGNVLTVITDKPIPHNNGGTVDYWQADILSSYDYSPFGVQLDGRTFDSEKYRYQFMGYEADNEPKGNGNSYTTEFRQYDPRLGRWLSLDPKMAKYPQISPYVAYANNPILFVDVDGDTIRLAGTKKEQWKALAFLQTLTNDKLTLKNGIVYIDMMNAQNCEKELPVGTDLVRDLVNHQRTVYIRQNTRNINQANHISGTDRHDETNGIGTNQIVDIDLTHLNNYLTIDPKTGESKWTHDAREITLAHELIHAFYGMEGKGYLYEEKATYIYKNEDGKMMQITQRREETETVGLTGERKYTENKIRKEQGAKTRAKY